MDSRECSWRLCDDSLLSTFRKKCHGLKTPYFGEFCVSLKTPGSPFQISSPKTENSFLAGVLSLILGLSLLLVKDCGFYMWNELEFTELLLKN